MADEQSTLRTFYDNWKKYQDELTRALAPLSPEQLALRAAPNLRSVDEIARHIIGARVGWFHFGLHEGGEDITPLETWDHDNAPQRTAAELVQGLETTWRFMQDALARWTPDDLAASVLAKHGGKEYSNVRQWVLWHLLEHDLHHGGEISLTLGMHGLAAPDI